MREFESRRGRRSRQGANLRVRAAWHAEPRYNAVATFDADLLDERLQERLAGRHGAVGERLCDVVPHGGDHLLAPGAQVAPLGGEPFEALAALGLGERAGLER
ncbi:MAG: hypothetical protein ACP5VR_09315 [Acidimicrobiales bacterium]